MSGTEKKRKAEELMLEKIYSKLKKLDDNYYNLKKTVKALQRPQDGGGSSETRKDLASFGVNSENSGFTECPDGESDRLKKSDIDGDETRSSELESRSTGENAITKPDDATMEASIDEEVLQLLGEDPSALKPKKFQFHSSLAARWEVLIASGLDKETRMSLLNEHSREGNCPLDAPILNPELVASLNETAVKRDKHFIDSQCLIGSAMVALGSAITLLLNEKEEGVDKNELLKLMGDAGKLMATLQHKESVARKAYILPGLDKKAKTILGKVGTDKYLFGEDLSENLKSAKAVEKAGLELKIQPARSTASKAPLKPNNSVNWKSPSVRFQRTPQSGSNQRGQFGYKSTRGRSDQENWKNRASEQQHKQKGSDKSSKGK